MLADEVAGQRLRQRLIQRFAAQGGAQPQAVYQRRQPVAGLLRLLEMCIRDSMRAAPACRERLSDVEAASTGSFSDPSASGDLGL